MTDDEIIERMFDEVKTVSVRTVNGKRFVADEETIRLSKSKFVAGCQCFKRLYSQVHEPGKFSSVQGLFPFWFEMKG